MKMYIALLLVGILIVAVAIGSTAAYLQETAHNDNIITLGNVDIKQ